MFYFNIPNSLLKGASAQLFHWANISPNGGSAPGSPFRELEGAQGLES